METKDIPANGAGMWIPMTDQHTIAILGKLGEEASELSTAIFRCLIQGMEEVHPETGKPNRQWIEEELADVLAMILTAQARLSINNYAISQRTAKKFEHKLPWFDFLVARTRKGS